MSGLSLYFKLLRASVRSRMQYRFNFVFTSLVAALISAADFLMVAVVLLRFDHVKQWNVYEIGYLYAVIILAKMLYRTFTSDMHHIEKYLVTGDLDQLMVRPVPVLFGLMTANVKLLPGELVQGTAVLSVCIGAMLRSGQLEPWAIPLTIYSILVGAVILSAIGLATATVGFWTTQVDDLQSFTEDAARNAGQYPLTLYPDWLKGILLTLLPVGFVNYLPALYLLKGELGPWVFAATGGVAIFAMGLALRFWRFGIRRYQSTGH
ncbi:ABC-2 family transporter protein [Paenibacillus sp.]|uniref:ABC transporter permease n=1 Tax=Paenibacillus sp. TaxID=58172 RepID=UPI002810C63D|nr:ABC-2 family transporter protein [Paenibacillus sp.]